MTTAKDASAPRENYLTANYGFKSWLLTTDHKRIGLLYLISISIFFLLGGMFAVAIRLELMTPEGDIFDSETYNKLFTQHGVFMVFFFLIPSIPAVIGNFVLPLMLGARDLAFPKLNLLSWYVYTVGALFTLWALIAGGVDTGWTFYTPYSSDVRQYQRHGRDDDRARSLLGFSLDLHRPELHRHDPQAAGAEDGLVPACRCSSGGCTGRA